MPKTYAQANGMSIKDALWKNYCLKTEMIRFSDFMCLFVCLFCSTLQSSEITPGSDLRNHTF